MGSPIPIVVMPSLFHLPRIQTLAGQDSNQSRPVETLLPMALSKDRLQELWATSIISDWLG